MSSLLHVVEYIIGFGGIIVGLLTGKTKGQKNHDEAAAKIAKANAKKRRSAPRQARGKGVLSKEDLQEMEDFFNEGEHPNDYK